MGWVDHVQQVVTEHPIELHQMGWVEHVQLKQVVTGGTRRLKL